MKNLYLISVFLFCSVLNLSSQNIVFNEFMSKNNSSIQDKDGDYSDWIELYNAGSFTINIANYCLSDDNNNLSKWKFPNVSIPAHGFILVFASSKNILDTNELHTNFKISSSGEKLYLSNDQGVLVSQTASVGLQADQSYGCIPDGSSNWIKINTPSPNQSNNSSNELLFSHSEGFYDTPFTLKINSLLQDTIYYTLNGDVPTESSKIFSDSLLISFKDTVSNVLSEIASSPAQNLIEYKAWESPKTIVDKATILRCVSYKTGLQTSKIYTKTYFVANNIFDKYTVPIISLISPQDNFFNYDTGIYVPGKYFNINDPEWTGNYFMQGIQWERDVHISFFNNDGGVEFSQDAGIRIHGGKTRAAAQKTLRLYAREEYGEKYFHSKIFPNKAVSKYKRLLLRTTMGDWPVHTLMKDVLAQSISSNLDIDHQDYRVVLVYLNGEYWGIHTIRDRIDERYIAYTHHVNKDSVEFNSSANPNYLSLISFIENNDLENENNYNYVKTKIDIHNYIDYNIAEMFFKNYDWPANNVKMWRLKPSGKWRWILYDLDASFGNADYNMFTHTTKNDTSIVWPNSPSSTFLFRNLLKNNEFKNQFIKRYAEILNKDFRIDNMLLKMQELKDIYAPELKNHINRWNFPNSYNQWEQNIIDDIETFIKERPCAVQKHLMEYFDLSEFDFDCHSRPFHHNTSSEISLAPNPNSGDFFIISNNRDLSDLSIIISNTSGGIVYTEKIELLKQNTRRMFHFNKLAKGVYFMQIRNSEVSERFKIIIMH